MEEAFRLDGDTRFTNPLLVLTVRMVPGFRGDARKSRVVG